MTEEEHQNNADTTTSNSETASTTESETDSGNNADTEHIITALEAYWVETQLVYDPDGTIGSDVTISADETVERVSGTTHAWEYECSCGAEFIGYGDAVTHLQETGAKTRTNTPTE